VVYQIRAMTQLGMQYCMNVLVFSQGDRGGEGTYYRRV